MWRCKLRCNIACRIATRYANYDHIGYTGKGERLIPTRTKDTLDEAIARSEDPEYVR